MGMPIIKISNFDGPFDLLLHLIKKNEMSINDIKIEEIISQYLEYISLMQELDLEITSEFIVMAATLIEIKSKALLPVGKREEEEVDSESLQKNLMNKLIEYKKFKKASKYFKEKDLMYGEVFTKKAEVIEIIDNIEIDKSYFRNITMVELYELYKKLIKNYNEKQNTNIIEKKISVDKYKIKDKVNLIRGRLKFNSIIRFSDLSYECECKLELVVTFLAILEMIKIEEIKVLQYDNFEEIIIEKVDNYE